MLARSLGEGGVGGLWSDVEQTGSGCVQEEHECDQVTVGCIKVMQCCDETLFVIIMMHTLCLICLRHS